MGGRYDERWVDAYRNIWVEHDKLVLDNNYRFSSYTASTNPIFLILSYHMLQDSFKKSIAGISF